jgi:hypothetical protein
MHTDIDFLLTSRPGLREGSKISFSHVKAKFIFHAQSGRETELNERGNWEKFKAGWNGKIGYFVGIPGDQ